VNVSLNSETIREINCIKEKIEIIIYRKQKWDLRENEFRK